jgi:hypothetical protein
MSRTKIRTKWPEKRLNISRKPRNRIVGAVSQQDALSKLLSAVTLFTIMKPTALSQPSSLPNKRNGSSRTAKAPRGANPDPRRRFQVQRQQVRARLHGPPLAPSVQRSNGTPPSAGSGNGAATAQQLRQVDKAFISLLGTGKGPSVTFVYQDEASRAEAKRIYDRFASLSASEGVRASWWRINELGTPGILAGAVSSAVRADMIVVASRAEGLPLPFYVWVNLWWPHRSQLPGTLVALLATNGTNCTTGSVADYLPMVAQQARMEFLKITTSASPPQKSAHVPVLLTKGISPCVNGYHLRD